MAYVETGNASEAYRQSYITARMKPETINRKAFYMLEQDKIRARSEDLQAEHRERHDVTMDSITDELEVARQQALDSNQNTAAIQASMGKARLHGLLVDKKDITVTKTTKEANIDELLHEFIEAQEVIHANKPIH